jgi:uncharacterized protein CbrC (UPF0167 family)
MNLPTFRYHPDPLASGSIVASNATCRCCEQSRGFIYTAAVYSEDELDDALCPWCIADGSAHKKFDATFVDSEALLDHVPAPVLLEITERTPGYSAWQQENWPVCCNDAAAFLEPVGAVELRARYRDQEGALMSHIVHEMKFSGGAAVRLLSSLRRDTSPTAYLFRCLHCERTLFHVDHL